MSEAALARLQIQVGELAVLRIVGNEVRQHGQCDRCVDEIAARAGVCRSLAKNALRTAARLGLLTVEERRRAGRRNLPNVVRIASREWSASQFTPTVNRPERVCPERRSFLSD